MVGGVDGENLRHVALALLEQHGRTMLRTFLAELVVQDLVEIAHTSVNAGIEFGRSEQQFYFGLLQLGQGGTRQLRCGIGGRWSGSAASSGGRFVCAAWSGDRAINGPRSPGSAGRAGTVENSTRRGGRDRGRARQLERRDIPLTGHEDRALHPYALGPLKLGAAEIGSKRSIAGRLRPDEHAVRIAFVLGDVRFHPLDHERNVFAADCPNRGRDGAAC